MRYIHGVFNIESLLEKRWECCGGFENINQAISLCNDDKYHVRMFKSFEYRHRITSEGFIIWINNLCYMSYDINELRIKSTYGNLFLRTITQRYTQCPEENTPSLWWCAILEDQMKIKGREFGLNK